MKLLFRTSVDERGRRFEPVSPAPTIRRPEVIATRPARSADGAVGVTVATASVLGMGLCLPGSGGGVASRDAMSALPETTENARWLSSQCPRCIADGSARRTSGSAGRLASSRHGDSQRRVCLGRGRSAAPASLHPAGNFVLRRWVEQEPATARLRSQDGHPGVASRWEGDRRRSSTSRRSFSA
jgi:hypothetical protein